MTSYLYTAPKTPSYCKYIVSMNSRLLQEKTYRACSVGIRYIEGFLGSRENTLVREVCGVLTSNSGPCDPHVHTRFKCRIPRYLHVVPPLVVTKMLLAPLVATPTKIRGVALPDVPDVLSKVTHAIPGPHDENTRRSEA